MYNGAARDRGDKKRQRITPPPNEVWMEAIMSNGKKTINITSASTAMDSGVVTSSSVAWQGRATSDYSQPAITPASSQYQHYVAASNYQGRMAERSSSYQARPPDTSGGSQVKIGLKGYSGRLPDGAQMCPAKPVNNASGYQAVTVSGTGMYQGRTIESSPSYQNRTMDGGYQRRLTEASTGYQVKALDTAAAYPRRIIYRTATNEERGVGCSTEETPFQGKTAETPSTLVKMAEDYKKDKKLPPRVEEMLREQVNLDESVLHDAFAVAMEDLIPEKEANFVAKGLCHLCGSNENYFVPVVNFCPHADEQHSLCREHLRSVYRVRMEALFVGRNGSAPNRRLLRCLMCTRGCPCSKCTAERKQDVQKYKRYLLDTLRRSGQGLVITGKDECAAPKAATSAKAAVVDITSEGRLTYGVPPTTSSSDDHRYAQYPPATASEARPLSQWDGISSRSIESGKVYNGHRQVQTQDSGNENYAVVEQNRHGDVASSMQAQPKSLYPPLPKRAAKDTSTSMLNVMADSAQAADARISARVVAPSVRQGFVESPSAATVLNCAESEKSLVQLLSSLNQSGTTTSSTAMTASNQSSKDNSQRQSDSRSGANRIAATSGSSENAQSAGVTEMEASHRVYPDRGRRFQEGSPYHDQSSTSSDESGGSPRHDASSAEAQSVDDFSAQKTNTSGNDANASLAPRDISDLASLDDGEAVQREESAAKAQFSEENRQSQFDPRLKLSVKLPDREKGNSNIAMKKENRLITMPTSSNRGPRRPRKPPSSGGVTPPSKKVASKVPSCTKKARGRPPKRAKRGRKDDDETEDETYDGEHGEKEEEDESGSDSELDANLDFCEVCQGAGDLVCCDKCPRSYHLKCLHMTEDDLPEGDWQCNECKQPSRFDAYSTAVALEKTLLDKCLKIVACLKSHPFSKPFLTPVENVPMYTRVVKQPMDLSKIENKLKKGAYVLNSNAVASGVKVLDWTRFANDIRLMWSNCKLFNDDGSGITRAADILSAGFERLFKESIELPPTS